MPGLDRRPRARTPTDESQAKVCPPLPHLETVADTPTLSHPAAQTDNAPAQVPQPQNLQNAKVAVCGQELRRHASSRFERYRRRPRKEPADRDRAGRSRRLTRQPSHPFVIPANAGIQGLRSARYPGPAPSRGDAAAGNFCHYGVIECDRRLSIEWSAGLPPRSSSRQRRR